jgi:prepilin-type N-terminal cleavage/methylation domain-containing protein
MRHSRRQGFQLIELVVCLAIAAALLGLAAAPLLRISSASRVSAAAAEVAGVLRGAKSYAIAHSANVGVKFRTLPDGAVVWGLYRDGDGDGVSSQDIASGVDPAIGPERRLAELGNSVRFGFRPGRAPRDPGTPSRRIQRLDDPLRSKFRHRVLRPLGGATPGSASHRRPSWLAAVRVLGMTGKVGDRLPPERDLALSD